MRQWPESAATVANSANAAVRPARVRPKPSAIWVLPPTTTALIPAPSAPRVMHSPVEAFNATHSICYVQSAARPRCDLGSARQQRRHSSPRDQRCVQRTPGRTPRRHHSRRHGESSTQPPSPQSRRGMSSTQHEGVISTQRPSRQAGEVGELDPTSVARHDAVRSSTQRPSSVTTR
jgi:hypothetical protein